MAADTHRPVAGRDRAEPLVFGEVESLAEDVADLKAQNRVLREELAAERQAVERLIHRLQRTERDIAKLRTSARKRPKAPAELRTGTVWRLAQPVRRLKGWLQEARARARRIGKRALDLPGIRDTAAKDMARRMFGLNTTVGEVARRMLSLGFVERGSEEMARLARHARSPRQRREAAWELATWHLNQDGPEHAEKALPFLAIAANDGGDAEMKRKSAIMQAEAKARTGNPEAARRVILDELAAAEHPDLLLALTTIEPDLDEKVRIVNRALASFGLPPVRLTPGAAALPYDRLDAEPSGEAEDQAGPLLSVIMPAFNGAAFITTAIRSMQAQTWRNFELLVVDDCSTDATREVVERLAADDARIVLLRTPRNSGPYVARNIGLDASSGEFITCNDADDWSHPHKLEAQLRNLLGNPGVLGNFSAQARVSPDLVFHRRSKPGQFVFRNMSSFMFRRNPVLGRLGYWDSVRFGGDNEFIKRLTHLFGEGAVADVPLLLSFQRQTENSLTGNSKFGYHGFLAGARRMYFELHRAHHAAAGTALYYSFPQAARPFPVPEPMLPERVARPGTRRHFDVIIASEFRLKGGSNLSNLEEIRAMKAAGLKVGLVQMSRYELDVRRPIRQLIVDEVDGAQVEFLVYGEEVSCDLLLVRYPPVLQDRQKWLPSIEAAAVKVIVNQPPMSDYGPGAERRYEIARCAAHLRELVDRDALWHPIGPAVRAALHEHHAAELSAIDLSEEDWVNIIDVGMWRREKRPERGPRIRIGRHSRDHAMKWPGDRATLSSIYPEDGPYEVCVMGGAEVPARILGGLPGNWRVLNFDAVPVREFLAGLDVFVYFTHPDWVEAFGRVVIEAMAVGVPVIVPESYRALLGEAALYAGSNGVRAQVDRLMEDEAFYQSQVDRAQAYVGRHFGYQMHINRVRAAMRRDASP